MKKILFTLFTFLISSGVYSQTLKIGDKAHGGIVAYVDGTGKHGIVCSFEDLGKFNWEDAKKACENYTSMGKSDWYLPSQDELNKLYENLHKKDEIGGLFNSSYWSSQEYGFSYAWVQVFHYGCQYFNTLKDNRFSVRAVRAF